MEVRGDQAPSGLLHGHRLSRVMIRKDSVTLFPIPDGKAHVPGCASGPKGLTSAPPASLGVCAGNSCFDSLKQEWKTKLGYVFSVLISVNKR